MTTSSARSLEGKVSAISGRTLGRLAIASVVYYVLAVLAMHLVQPELDPLAVPMSVYVLGAYGSVMTTTFFVLCAGILGVGFGLIQTLPRTGAIKVAFWVTLIASAGFLIAGIFPTDWPPPMRSTSSQLHVLGGLLAFPSMIIATCLFSLKFRRDGYWRRVSGIALTLSACVFAAYIMGIFFVAAQFGFIGLVQRLFLALLFAWMILVGLHLNRAPRAM